MFDSLNRWGDRMVLRRRLARSRHAASYDDVPAALLPYWRRTADAEFAGIPRSADFFARSLDGLLTYFECVCAAGAPCALPARAADSVWHAWIALDRAGLERFCVRHFGGVLPHIESGDMPDEPSVTLAACLTAARRLEALPAANPGLPALFTLDSRLRMPFGFHYVCVDGKVGYGRLDSRGRSADKLHFPRALSAEGLFEAGVISEHEYKLALAGAALQRKPAKSGAGNSDDYFGAPLVSDSGGAGHAGTRDCAAALGEAGCDSDTSSCDGGGSSCGSNCGSSCGSGGSD
jgi:hypothetical protein